LCGGYDIAAGKSVPHITVVFCIAQRFVLSKKQNEDLLSFFSSNHNSFCGEI